MNKTGDAQPLDRRYLGDNEALRAGERVLGRSGRWLVIHAFALLDRGADSGKVALVIEPAKAAEIAPIIVEAYQLGPREQQVTALVARGLATAEIAATLSLSAHTVRDYLKQVGDRPRSQWCPLTNVRETRRNSPRFRTMTR